LEHASAHILNTPVLERQYAKAYLGPPDSREAINLRKEIAKGAREALEEQYWDVIESTIQSRPLEARLGGDPSVSNKIRAYLLMRYYQNGEWADRIEVCISNDDFNLTKTGAIACCRATTLGKTLHTSSYRTLAGSLSRSRPILASD
jgi:hypothetical protein